ncbi:hypothetical protein GPECTOR_31g362 [Gonium pectorale]|uniref:Pherophorin domain-containing protein n=1 Tax=Gonium pectorale TaxID=33097 RepID=A0A150GDW1_GONPE|nr:hypothetical protein GPECTOR_31g362 [Gonium pectorale]|eukprot:KXZ47998.1 hypothetical protein GPECTOR_31g362 [Gonium pectorale]
MLLLCSSEQLLQTLLGAPGSGFPWCQCVSYDCKCSPYSLTLANVTKARTTTTTCFDVVYRGCDTSLACCRGMLDAVDKLSLETTASCATTKSYITKVTVDGKTHFSWNTLSHATPSGGTGYELKIYNLGMSNASLPGSQVCVYSQRPCLDTSDLLLDNGRGGSHEARHYAGNASAP